MRPWATSVIFDAQRLARKDWRRIHIDRLKEATLEEWISASEDLLGVADLERDTEHLKDIRESYFY